MTRALAALLFLLAMILFAGLTHAAGPPLALAHTLIGQSRGDTTSTLDYSVHLRNDGDSGISEISLSLVPLPPLRGSTPTLNVGYLGPHEEVDLAIQVVTPMRLDAQRLSQVPLFWAGKCLDQEGTAVEFPARSVQGGAK